jgi:ubiquinone/menaquinone biosynthesis C-methylase UbiE
MLIDGERPLETRRYSLLDQCRKPTGWLGRAVLWEMNVQHSGLTNWGLSHVPIGESNTILDIGCGGGRTIAKLAARASQGSVYGIDHSAESVAMARRTNARGMKVSQVEIRQGSVSQLPFPEGMFDLVTAVENHFYWPNLPGDVREVLRVLKPSGSLLLIAEVYKGSKSPVGMIAEKYTSFTGMILLDVDEHHKLLESAGYAEVQVSEKRSRGWICATGRKPRA